MLGPALAAIDESNLPRLRWELVMEFDSGMQRMEQSYCNVTTVTKLDKDSTQLSKEITALHRRLEDDGPIRVFEGACRSTQCVLSL